MKGLINYMEEQYFLYLDKTNDRLVNGNYYKIIRENNKLKYCIVENGNRYEVVFYREGKIVGASKKIKNTIKLIVDCVEIKDITNLWCE